MNVKDVFSEVYERAFSTAHTLFTQMDKEQICSVILDGGTY